MCFILPLSAGETDGGIADELPSRILLLRWGENKNANGARVVVGNEFREALEGEYYPYKRIALDFEHNTCPGTPEYEHTKEPRAIAAYGDIECVPGVGVFLRISRWTPAGRAHARDYEDVSAAPLCDAAGNVRAIPSAALCRTGAVPGVSFRESPISATPAAPGGETNGNGTEETSMDYREKLVKLLGLAEDSTDDVIEAAYDLMLSKAAEAAAAEDAADAEKTEETLQTLSAKVTAYGAELKRLRAAQELVEKDRILAEARSAGKVVPLSASAIARLTVADIRAVCDETPVTVPLSAITPATVPERSHAVREESMRIAELCGVSAEALR